MRHSIKYAGTLKMQQTKNWRRKSFLQRRSGKVPLNIPTSHGKGGKGTGIYQRKM
jgi:hypothetical protein